MAVEGAGVDGAAVGGVAVAEKMEGSLRGGGTLAVLACGAAGSPRSNAGLGYFMDATVSQLESVIVDLHEYRQLPEERVIPLLLQEVRSKTQRAQKAHLLRFLRYTEHISHIDITLDDALELLVVLFVLLRRRGGCTTLQMTMNHQVSDLCFQLLSALYTRPHRHTALFYYALDRLVYAVYRRKSGMELDRMKDLGVLSSPSPSQNSPHSPKVRYRQFAEQDEPPTAEDFEKRLNASAEEDAKYEKAAAAAAAAPEDPPAGDAAPAGDAGDADAAAATPPAMEVDAPTPPPAAGSAAGGGLPVTPRGHDGRGSPRGSAAGTSVGESEGAVELYKLGAELRELKNKRNALFGELADEAHWREPRDDTDPFHLTLNSIDAGELGTVSEAAFQCAVRDHHDMLAAYTAATDGSSTPRAPEDIPPKPAPLLEYLYNAFPYTPDRYIQRRYDGKVMPDKAPVPLCVEPPPYFALVSPLNVDVGDDGGGVGERPEENIAIPPKPPTEDVQLAYVALCAVDYDGVDLLTPGMLVANSNVFYNVRSSAKREFGVAEILQLWYPKTFDAAKMTLEGMKERKEANDSAYFEKSEKLRQALLQIHEQIAGLEEQIRMLENSARSEPDDLEDNPLCFIVGGILLTDEMLLLDPLLEADVTRPHAKQLLECFDSYGFDVTVFCSSPSLYLPTRLSCKGLVFRDFTTCPPCPQTHGVPAHITPPNAPPMSLPAPLQQLHFKTNIHVRSDIKYRFHFEGMNFGVNQPVNSVVVGSVGLKWDRLDDMAFYGWPDGWDSATTACYSGGIQKMSQYFSADGYVTVQLEARSFSNAGITATGWIYPPNYGQAFGLSASWHHTNQRL